MTATFFNLLKSMLYLVYLQSYEIVRSPVGNLYYERSTNILEF